MLRSPEPASSPPGPDAAQARSSSPSRAILSRQCAGASVWTLLPAASTAFAVSLATGLVRTDAGTEQLLDLILPEFSLLSKKAFGGDEVARGVDIGVGHGLG